MKQHPYETNENELCQKTRFNGFFGMSHLPGSYRGFMDRSVGSHGYVSASNRRTSLSFHPTGRVWLRRGGSKGQTPPSVLIGNGMPSLSDPFCHV